MSSSTQGPRHGTGPPRLQERGKDSPGEEEPLPGQGERSSYPKENGVGAGKVTVAVVEEGTRRKQRLLQPSQSLGAWLGDEQQEETHLGDGYFRHQLLQDPAEQPLADPRRSQPPHDLRRNLGLLAPNRVRQAMVERDLQVVAAGFGEDEGPLDLFLLE